jgi:pyruvate/2-oxoglutarate dehydrogenase complex dihydrolipoamide dehydrogenase (E3) component
MVNERIEVMTNAMAEEITAECVKLKGDRNIDTENVIWTAGNRASVKTEDLDLQLQGEKGIETDEYMRVSGPKNVWAIGDLVGEPMLEHKAAAQGEMVAELIAGHLAERSSVAAGGKKQRHKVLHTSPPHGAH